mmetsp:Transcript_7311/g.32251  ORF Transcript_7311/g.32251 Transcript_7311/m.32251 type:complete len:225 (-) Transcript_7311:48-722(-)
MPPRHRVHHRVGVHGQVSAVRAIHALPRGRRRLRGPLHPFRLGRRRQRRQRVRLALHLVDAPGAADDVREVDDGEDRDDAVGARVLHQRLRHPADDPSFLLHGRVRQRERRGDGRRRVVLAHRVVRHGRRNLVQRMEDPKRHHGHHVHARGRAEQDGDHRIHGDCLAQRHHGGVHPRARVLHPVRAAVPGRAQTEGEAVHRRAQGDDVVSRCRGEGEDCWSIEF